MKPRHPGGFTLIEVVVAIIFSAFAMAAILPFLGDVFYRSSEPLTQMHDALALQAAMEGLVADYVTLATNETLADFQLRAGSVVAAVAPSVTVVSNNFTRFLIPSGLEAVPTNYTLLKISLRNRQGETATRLFGRPFQQ
jgi:Tfp pilus assembly protein PilV